MIEFIEWLKKTYPPGKIPRTWVEPEDYEYTKPREWVEPPEVQK